jgi:phospholipid/cholesterol/gamma-HCH transport system substrate-binding protein
VRWVSRLVVVAIVVAVVGGIALVVRSRVDRAPPGGFATYALFHDASKLPIGSRVMINGVQVGRIDALGVDGRLARISMRLVDDVVIYDDAWAEKKADSVFGDGYIAIHPGADGPGRRRLVSGEPIPRVIEGASTDRTLRQVDQALPVVQENLAGAVAFLDEARRTVNGPFATRLEEIDQTVRSGVISEPFDSAERGIDALDRWTADAAGATRGLDRRVNPQLDDAARTLDQATRDLRQAEVDLRAALADARTGMDKADPYIHDAAELVARLNGQVPPEEQGTLGRLINDPELGNDLDEATEGLREATSSLGRLQTFVGLRAELGILKGNSRVYLSAEISGRFDNFYLIEAQKTSYGDYPDVTLADAANDDRFVRRAVIEDQMRLTVQWGRQLGWLRVRFGLFEDNVGIGADALLFGGRLKLAADVSGTTYARVPRLKLAAAVHVFETLYINAGIDDVLSAPGTFPVNTGPEDVPGLFAEYSYGREPFLGASLSFSDDDLDELLLLYGAIVFAALT